MSEVIVAGEVPLTKARKESEGSDTDHDSSFASIVALPEVKVVTNEEQETVLLKLRAKLYRFDSTLDPPEWKERGIGELKILQHEVSNAIRIVMRRDKTFKVCANHFITPWMELRPSIGNEKAFVYTVLADFADELPKSECFAVKFGTVESATSFKNKFNEAKEILLKECDLYNGNAEANDRDTDDEDEDDDDEEENDNKENSLKEVEGVEVSGKEIQNNVANRNGEIDKECAEVMKKIIEMNVNKDED